VQWTQSTFSSIESYYPVIPTYTQQRELNSTHPFVPAAMKLLKYLDKSNITAALWADRNWDTEWQINTSCLQGRSHGGPRGETIALPKFNLPSKQFYPVLTSEFLLHFNWHHSNNWSN